jgi:hypothetical protein
MYPKSTLPHLRHFAPYAQGSSLFPFLSSRRLRLVGLVVFLFIVSWSLSRVHVLLPTPLFTDEFRMGLFAELHPGSAGTWPLRLGGEMGSGLKQAGNVGAGVGPVVVPAMDQGANGLAVGNGPVLAQVLPHGADAGEKHQGHGQQGKRGDVAVSESAGSLARPDPGHERPEQAVDDPASSQLLANAKVNVAALNGAGAVYEEDKENPNHDEHAGTNAATADSKKAQPALSHVKATEGAGNDGTSMAVSVAAADERGSEIIAHGGSSDVDITDGPTHSAVPEVIDGKPVLTDAQIRGDWVKHEQEEMIQRRASGGKYEHQVQPA